MAPLIQSSSPSIPRHRLQAVAVRVHNLLAEGVHFSDKQLAWVRLFSSPRRL